MPDGTVLRKAPSGRTVTSESTVSMPSPTSNVEALAGSPNRTARPWIRPRAFLGGRDTGARTGWTGSSQVRWIPCRSPSSQETAATSAGNRRHCPDPER